MSRDDPELREYQERVGDPRNLPDDHPDRWQWDYRGTKDEREGLLERLADTEAPPAVDPDQPSLF